MSPESFLVLHLFHYILGMEKLSHEAKEALRKFDELAGNTLNQAGKNDGEKEKPEKKKKGFMDKVKEAFDD